jgi:protein-disulfide isomerase
MIGRGWPGSTCIVSAQAAPHTSKIGPTNFHMAVVGYDSSVRVFLLLLFCRVTPAEELTTDGTHEIRHIPAPPYPVRGPRFAPVTVDLYFSFGHSPSAVGAELARRAVENARAQDVREVLRLAPPGPISNSAAGELGAEALIEAEAQGRAFPFLDRFLHERAALNAAELVRAGVDAGLDGEKLAAALADHRHTAEVERRTKEASQAGHAAGELLINGRRSSVWVNEEGLSATIQEARKRAQALLDSGVPLGRLYDAMVQPEEPRPPEKPRVRLVADLAGAPMRGAPTAPITIVVFSNLACSACSDAADVLRRLREAWPGRIREVWLNHVPAYLSGTSIDMAAAELAAAATAQGKFWALHDAVLRLQRRGRAELEAAARDAGVDLSRRDSAAEKRQVAHDLFEGRRLGVPIAPSLFVNGVLFAGMPQLERLDRAVRAELQRGLLDRLSTP